MYGRMLEDGVRREAYAEALRRLIKPETIVLEIGTGPGVFALLACQYGARKVYAIEPDDSIQVAREMAALNGCADRISFIQDILTRVTLPEKVNLIVSDLRGTLPLMQLHLPTIVDARRRFLADGGVLIPRRDRLWAAVVEAGDLYHQHLSFWHRNELGLNTGPAHRIVANTWLGASLGSPQMLTEPHCWATLDYATVEVFSFGEQWTSAATRSGTAHGLAVWFDAELCDGVSFSTAPGSPKTIYALGFFPWLEPVEIGAGDKFELDIQADLVADDYTWRWNACVSEGGPQGHTKASFKQSSFFGVPLSPEGLRKRAANHRPDLNEEGEADRLVLDLMAQGVELGEIARSLVERFPSRFAGRSQALARVADLSQKYSR